MYLFLKKGWLKSVTSALNFNILLSLPGGKPATEKSSKELSLISWEQTVSPPISLRGLGMPLTAHGTCFPPSRFSFSRISHSCKVTVTIAPSATCLGCSEDHLREWLQESFMNSPLGQRPTGMTMAAGCSRQSTQSGVWGPGWEPSTPAAEPGSGIYSSKLVCSCHHRACNDGWLPGRGTGQQCLHHKAEDWIKLCSAHVF